MNGMKLKAALAKFKDAKSIDEITATGEYTPEESAEIWDALSGGSVETAIGTAHTDHSESDELTELKAENERLKSQLPTEKPKLKTRNEGLSIPKFTGNKLQGEDFQNYLETVRGLDHRTIYDWTEYKAIGVFNKYEDPQSGDIVEGNILVGIELVDSVPLKHTAIEARHIETWATTPKGKKIMQGLNAQIYAKDNNRANSRYYILKSE